MELGDTKCTPLTWMIEKALALPTAELQQAFERIVLRILDQLRTYPLSATTDGERLIDALLINITQDNLRPWHAHLFEGLLHRAREIDNPVQVLNLDALGPGEEVKHPTMCIAAPRGVLPFIRLLSQHGCTFEECQGPLTALHLLCLYAPPESVKEVLSDRSLPIDPFARSAEPDLDPDSTPIPYDRTARDKLERQIAAIKRQDLRRPSWLERFEHAAGLLREREDEWRSCVYQHLQPHLIHDLTSIIISYVDATTNKDDPASGPALTT